MSLALKQSKARMGQNMTSGAMISRRAYMGDPGIFGFLGKVAGGIAKTAGGLIPGPVGDILEKGGQLISGGGPGGAAGTPGISMTPPSPIGRTFFPQQQPVVPKPGPRGAIERFLPGGETGYVPAQGTKLACPSGYHPNKSDYFLKDGTFVPKGSKCVKNRRKNPLNPKAASRAISRLEQAKRAVKRLDRVNIKCKKCGYSRCRC